MQIPWNILRKTLLGIFCAAAAAGSLHSYLEGAALQEPSVLYDSVPPAAEESRLPAEPQILPQTQDGRIDLNRATEEELCTLKGIGPAKAKAILEYRESYGGFVCAEEILEVKGIGPGTFEKIKEFIFVEDKSFKV